MSHLRTTQPFLRQHRMNLFSPLWERSYIFFRGKDDGTPELSGFSFHSVSTREFLKLRGNSPGSIFLQPISNQHYVFRDLTHSGSTVLLCERVELSNGAMPYEFREVCLLFGQKNNLPKFSVCCAVYCRMDPNFQTGLWQRIQTIGKGIQKCSLIWQCVILILKDFWFYLPHLSHACVKGKFPVRSWIWPLGVLQSPHANTRSEKDLIRGSLQSGCLP